MLHQTIKNQIKEALRAKDSIRLETLRGLNALFLNEILASKIDAEFLPDEKVLTLIKRSVKQRKDSISQFEIGNRPDLAQKEKAELSILESFMPETMPYSEVKLIVRNRIDSLKAAGTIDEKAVAIPAFIGKLTGMIVKELAGKADNADIRKAIEETLTH